MKASDLLKFGLKCDHKRIAMIIKLKKSQTRLDRFRFPNVAVNTYLGDAGQCKVITSENKVHMSPMLTAKEVKTGNVNCRVLMCAKRHFE